MGRSVWHTQWKTTKRIVSNKVERRLKLYSNPPTYPGTVMPTLENIQEKKLKNIDLISIAQKINK